MLKQVVESRKFEIFVIVLLMVNFMVHIAETYNTKGSGALNLLHQIDHAFLLIFSVEILMKMWVYRKAYFTKWNLFDVTLVSVSIVATFADNNSTLGAVLGAMRSLRVCRIFTLSEEYRFWMRAILYSFRSGGVVVSMAGVFMAIYALIGHKLFSELNPEHFQNFHTSLSTVFQVLTFDSWSEIKEALKKKNQILGPVYINTFIGASLAILILIGAVVGGAIIKFTSENKRE